MFAMKKLLAQQETCKEVRSDKLRCAGLRIIPRTSNNIGFLRTTSLKLNRIG